MAFHAKGASAVARRAMASTRYVTGGRKPRKGSPRSKASNLRLGGGENGVASTAINRSS